MIDKFKVINQDDVVSVDPSNKAIVDNSTFRIAELAKQAKKNLLWGKPETVQTKWTTEGVECEILQLGTTSWQKGKVRLRIDLEFCPDELDESQLDSPLDDLRQIITES